MSAAKVYDDILGLARKESARVGHFYIGVEHLFIALTRLDGGVTVSTLEEQGIAPRFVRYMIRQDVGQGDNRRFWPGFRETPRLHTVLRLARELAQEKGRQEPAERDLLLAILREGDSLPYRVLKGMDVDLDRLEVNAANWTAQMRMQPVLVPVQVEEGVTLSEDEELVLQQMFRGYARVVVERQLDRGHTSAHVVVACPYRADGRASASVVVKLDERHAILYEKMRYDSYVRDTLPPASARVVDNPIVPNKSVLGGLKYTFIRDPDAPGPVDLYDYATEHGPEALAELLWNGLYRVFGETWWSQGMPYQFGVWQEYEMVLPPSLVVEVLPGGSNVPPRRRLTPLGQWSRRGRFAHHEIVSLEGFTVEQLYPDREALQLTSGSGPDAQNSAGKIEVRGIKLDLHQFGQGRQVGQLVGRVLYTRDDLLYQQAASLQPEFDLNSDRLPEHALFPVQLPNPIKRYSNLLQRRVVGSLSTIHGDLHVHNVLVGPGGNAWLIDFAQAREGHTLFDWAVLEASLLTDIVAPAVESDDWDSLWAVLPMLADIAQTGLPPVGQAPLERALHVIVALREIVRECLADPDDWREYYVALAMCTLRGLRWVNTLSLKERRLLFLVSALAMASAYVRDSVSTATIPDIDATDINLHMNSVISSQQLRSPRPGSREEQSIDVTEDNAGAPVQFSAYYPGQIRPGEWEPLYAYVFRSFALAQVARDAQQQLAGLRNQSDSDGRRTRRSTMEGARIKAVPYLPGFQFNPASVSIFFHEDWHRLDFRVRAIDAEAYTTHRGFITFSIEGVIVGDVPLTVTVEPDSAGQRMTSNPVKPYQSIYCCYSPEDASAAIRVESVYKMLGMDFMRAAATLRSSLDWQDEMQTMIGDADIFQLFWSDHAAKSAVIRREWRHAIMHPHPERFIRPVYWSQPMTAPPPELAHLPFVFYPELGQS